MEEESRPPLNIEPTGKGTGAGAGSRLSKELAKAQRHTVCSS